MNTFIIICRANCIRLKLVSHEIGFQCIYNTLNGPY